VRPSGEIYRPVGIADFLFRWQLSVPLNQRPDAWEEDRIGKLFQDLTNAFNRQPLYFHGTVMFTHGDEGYIEVADGQQRLTTISILIAAIRDYLIELGDTAGALTVVGRRCRGPDRALAGIYSFQLPGVVRGF